MRPTTGPNSTKVLSADLRNLRVGAPEVMKAFSAHRPGGAGAPSALDAKTKELIALGDRASRCAATIASPSTPRPRSIAGATREEVLETLGMAIYMGAGPSAMYASHALGGLHPVRGGQDRGALNGRR